MAEESRPTQPGPAEPVKAESAGAAGPATAGPAPARPESGQEPPLRRTSVTPFEVMNRRVLVALVVLLGIGLLALLRGFIAPIVVALTFAALFYPFYRWLVKLTGERRKGLASLICCLVLLVGLLVPIYVVAHIVAIQTVELYNTAGTRVREVVRKGSEGPLGRIQRHPAARWLRLQEVDWQGVLQESARAAGKVGSFVVNKTSLGIFAAALNLFVVFFTMFYLFRDGEAMLGRVRYLSPLRNEYEDVLFQRFLLISRASIRGTVLIGLIQGALGALTFLVFGVKTWLLWGFVMVILSILPFTGAWFVMVPAGIIQLVLGNVVQGTGILVVCVALVSTIDNVLRPRLVGNEAKLHDLLIFFSTLGGISVFGVWGFIVGPVAAALFVALLDIYSREYEVQLTAAHTAQTGDSR